jgi:excisionase family DNA binding protein
VSREGIGAAPTRLLLGLDEAALQLGISRRTVQSLIYSGELPSVRIARRRLVAAVDLEEYVGRLRDESAG